MFPHQERLARATFPSVLAHGRRFSSTHFTALASEEEKGYAVVVSKKSARLSVTRHRIKRRVLAALKTLPLPTSLILFPKSATSTMAYEDIKKELTDLLSKISHSRRMTL
ncbi:MAG: ribonuclease P protein component [Minisyncoccota bacterium]